MDLWEYVYGTEPNEFHTAGDGYSDGGEVAAGTSPTDPASNPSLQGEDGWNRKGHAYGSADSQGKPGTLNKYLRGQDPRAGRTVEVAREPVGFFHKERA